MKTLWILSILFIYLCIAELNVPDLLANEKNNGNPGVISRLSQKGLNYAVRIISNLLLDEIATAKVNIEPISIKAQQRKMLITNLKLVVNSPLKEVRTDTGLKNTFFFSFSQMQFTLQAELKIDDDTQSSTRVEAKLDALNAQVFLNISALRTSQGTANFRLDECRVKNNDRVTVSVSEAFFTSSNITLKEEIEKTLEMESGEVLNNLVCTRIAFVLDDRINNRFALLTPKLTLGKVSERVILTDLIGRLRAARRQSRADILFLDYTIVSNPRTNALGFEIENSGEVSLRGQGGTPFGPVLIPFPQTLNDDYMLQMAVSDFVPNSLLYHGHTIGLFNTRIGPKTPRFGQIMRTTCNTNSQLLFCLGNLFPTLKALYPNQRLALLFNTVQAPVLQFNPISSGGITFLMLGKIDVFLSDGHESNSKKIIAEMRIDVKAHMKLKILNTSVRPKIIFDSIKMTTLSPLILLQTELNEAVLLTREVLQRMVNDVLADGLPIPVYPLFKLNKPKIKLLNRALLLQTNFDMNNNLLRQIIAPDLINRNLSINLNDSF